MSIECQLLKYADVLVVYMAYRLFDVARELVQTAYLHIIVPLVLVRIGSYVLRQMTCFNHGAAMRNMYGELASKE
jgi:hypothetical protein